MDELTGLLKNFVIDNLGGGSFSARDIPNFIFGILLTAFLSWMLGLIYIRYGHALSNRRLFSRNFILIAVTTMVIISVVKSSLALSLGLVGALSIVRFRSAIKEPEELSYLFITIAIGLGMGAGFAVLTCIAFVLLCVIIWARYRYIKPADNQNLYITFSVPDHQQISFERITGILTKHSLQVKLKRSDESQTAVEASFLVEFESLGNLENARQELRTAFPSASITFMDNTRDF